MRRALFLFLFLFWLFPSPIGALEEDPKIWNLQGISALQLVVERPTADALQAGISEQILKDQVSALFQSSLPRMIINQRDSPSLYVRVVLHKRQMEDLYYGSINVTIDRPVLVLFPGGSFPALSQVWESSMVFSGRDPVLATYQILARLVSLLIEDLKKASQKPPTRGNRQETGRDGERGAPKDLISFPAPQPPYPPERPSYPAGRPY